MSEPTFGTDGVRGVAGRAPMRAEDAFALGVAATEARRAALGTAPRWVMGRDTRHSGDMLQHAFAAGAMARGAGVPDAGVLPTPAVAFLVRHVGADGGVVVSASHNPFEDNGIKLFGPGGAKLADAEEADVEARLCGGAPDGAAPTGAAIGRRSALAGADPYLAFLWTHAPYLDGARVVVDAAHGAASALVRPTFERIGARLETLHADPDGVNINVACGSTHPEALRERVLAGGFDVGVALDGDADRAILIDAKARTVTGDHVLAIVARVRGDREVVGTVMSNLGVERWLAERGVTMHRTQVGDRYVRDALVARDLRLGGEPSGHVLMLDAAPTGDGLLTALQLLAAVRASGRPLEAWMDDVPTYPQTLRSVDVPAGRKAALAEDAEVRAAVADAEAALGADGRVNLRPSGTEARLRVMVEGRDDAQVHALADAVADAIRRAAAAPAL
jgi:phosphoglucosamine mutase